MSLERPASRARGAALTLLTGAAILAPGACTRATPSAHRTDDPASAGPSPADAPPGRAGAGRATLTIRCKAPSHPISPLIYGIGVQPMRDRPEQWKVGATARRWGGNHTSRYNWELGNAWNTGKDWFFKNVDYDDGKKDPAYQRFLDDDAAHGVSTALTVPMLGWVAKDTRSYSFPVSTFGAQHAAAPEDRDIGDGMTRAGGLVPPGSPTQTSVPMTPASIGRWVQRIRARAEGNKGRGVHTYILDNEPTLWSETHRDVHPEPVSYDELLEKTIAYATEIRRADPSAAIAGPAAWGWTAYFFSGVDKAAYPAHPDRDRHGGVPLIPWWLGEVAAQEARAGLHLLDLLDVHFYPQGQGIGIGAAGNTDPDTAARRIRATRALWDPTYKDESWIADEVKLIPRLKAWIAEKHPGLGISLGEYNFGAETHMSGGLAVAEALGRFGEQGVTSAYYWDYPPPGSPAFWAFQAYRDFDGKGGRFLDESVPAESSDRRASIFVSRGDRGGHLVAVLLDLDPAAKIEATLDAGACGRITGERRFVYGQGAAGFMAASADLPTAGAPALTLPPYSITVLDLLVANEP